MLNFAVFFFVIALSTAVFGFSGDAQSALGHSAVGIAQVLFFVFAVLAIASLLVGLSRRARLPSPPTLRIPKENP